jgi:hypothetical protein
MRHTSPALVQTSLIAALTLAEDRPNMKTLPTRFCLNAIAYALIFTCATLASPSAAQTMHIDTGGRGQVLIYPYYTVRNGTVSLISMVNQTISSKALRLRVRESVGGRSVAEINVFLSPKDVWTAAIVPAGDGAAIISNDKSCTNPVINNGTGNGLAFSSAAFIDDGAPPTQPTQTTRPALDRVREGYIEVIEMAAVPYESALGKDIVHIAGVPRCTLTTDPVVTTDPTNSTLITIKAPSGGLTGSMSFINLNDGLGVSYNATAINGFWKTGADAPALNIPPISVSAPDLASGGNGNITVTNQGKTYLSSFTRSIDAVSALFMSSTINGEYGFTADGVFSNAWVITTPTKPYYIYSATLGPFQRAFSPATAEACDDGILFSVDREEFVGASNDNFPTPPPGQRPAISWCANANVYGFAPYSGSRLGVTPTAFDSPRMQLLSPIQNAGQPAPIGKEGGHLQITPTQPSARLVPARSSVLTRSATTGELEWVSAAHTYFGLPMLGFALSVAKYNTGSPQQNFGNLNALSTQRSIE